MSETTDKTPSSRRTNMSEAATPNSPLRMREHGPVVPRGGFARGLRITVVGSAAALCGKCWAQGFCDGRCTDRRVLGEQASWERAAAYRSTM